MSPFDYNTLLLGRRSLVVAAIGVMWAGVAVAAPAPALRVLFICEAGTVKSPVAREYLRRRAAARGISIVASSRGIAPADHVSPQLRAALAADRIDTGSEPLRRLETSDVAAADIVIYFNRPETVALPADARDWTGVESMDTDFAAAQADMVQRIDALLDTIAARQR